MSFVMWYSMTYPNLASCCAAAAEDDENACGLLCNAFNGEGVFVCETFEVVLNKDIGLNGIKSAPVQFLEPGK